MSEVLQEFKDRLARERQAAEERPVKGDAEPTEEPDGDPLEGETGSDDPGHEEELDDLDPESGADDGDPEDGEFEPDERYKELEEKYKSLESEFSRLTAHRKEREQTIDRLTTEAVQFKQEIEDSYAQAQNLTQAIAGAATQRLNQLQSINPGNLSQEQFVQWQTQLQQANHEAQQLNGFAQHIQAQLKEQREATLRREAAIARERLKSRIPDWSGERYRELAAVAEEYGYTPEEYFSSTDHRLILILNELSQSKEATKVIEKKKQEKPKPPRNSSGRAPDRGQDGKFRSAERAFNEATPGTKGSFAAMKAAQLKAERQRKG